MNLVLVAQVEARANGRCEACTLTLFGRRGSLEDDAIHHRVGGAGRTRFEVLNGLLLVHGRCHRWIHANGELSRDLGLIVPRETAFRMLGLDGMEEPHQVLAVFPVSPWGDIWRRAA